MDKIAVVSGCASGIGQKCAEKFLKENYYVYGLDVKKCKTSHKFTHINCDVSDEEQVKNAIKIIQCYYNKIDVLVNVAGILGKGKKTGLEEQSICDWNYVLKNNLTSVLIMIKQFIPLLCNNTNGGCIINLSSDQTFQINAKSAPYAVSKAGINILTKIAAKELYPFNIRVNAIAPSAVRTHFLDELVNSEAMVNQMMESMNNVMPFGILTPQEIGDIVFFFAATKKITGQIFLVDSGKLLV